MSEEMALLKRLAAFLHAMGGGPVAMRIWDEFQALRVATVPYLPKVEDDEGEVNDDGKTDG